MIDTRGLKFKLWTYFILFASGIMALLWILQSIFLSTFYESMKSGEIEKIGRQVYDRYAGGDGDFVEYAHQAAFQNGVDIKVLSETGEVLVGTFGHIAKNDGEFRYLKDRLNESGQNMLTYLVKQPDNRMNLACFAAKLEDGGCLYITSPLEPIGAAETVIKNQLIIVSAISLMLAFLVSYFLARGISRPIVSITRQAKGLADGKSQTEFDEDGAYTEINQLGKTLNQTARELAKTDALRRDLVANVSHDLRTPLTIIKSYAEMIRDISGENPEKRAAHTKVIIEEADRLSTLVSDLLDLSKIESGTQTLDKKRFDLSKTARQILSRFDVLAQTEGYQFTAKCEPEAFVFADEAKICQVVYNLVINAVHFTGDDKAVTVCVEKQKGGARFSVKDTGSGIAPEKLEQIWERYYKASEQTQRQKSGSGLGLTIVKGILEEHGAKYGAISELGKGSTFWFELADE